MYRNQFNTIPFTKEQTNNILKDFINLSISMKSIGIKYDRSIQSIYSLANKHGVKREKYSKPWKKHALIKKGDKIGKLTILEDPIRKQFRKNKENQIVVQCKCDCGKISELMCKTWNEFNPRMCRSCTAKLPKKRPNAYKGSSFYNRWRGIKDRCYNPNSRGYPWCGKKGIIMCEEWKNSCQVFYDWSINNGYEKGLVINRIDPNGNYCPENCEYITSSANSIWVTKGREQQIGQLKQQVIQLQTENLKLNQIIDDINHSLILSTV